MKRLETETVRLFGEMGGRWGISRTVAQILGWLIVSEAPRPADEICAELGISRSNVSTGLRELEAWGLIERRHLPGDRRDHFAADADVWELARRLAAERKRRELDPFAARLAELAAEKPGKGEAHAAARVTALADLAGRLSAFHDEMQGLETERLRQIVELGAKLGKIAKGKKKKG